MSAITPTVSTRNSSPAFTRPIPPAPDLHRDAEMLNYYFDSTWTTKDIANHFNLSVAVVATWFQRPDIVALIDFITAANERRARDITRESLPGTIDILLRISRVRNDDKTSRAASSALITFARGRANMSEAKHASNASRHSRAADTSPPRDLQPARETRNTPSRATSTDTPSRANSDNMPSHALCDPVLPRSLLPHAVDAQSSLAITHATDKPSSHEYSFVEPPTPERCQAPA
jgi:hypothetical protein